MKNTESNALKHVIEYSAAPDADSFRHVAIDELRAIQSEITESLGSARTEWSRDAMESDSKAAEMAISLAESGRIVYVARDDDGYYFATERSFDHFNRRRQQRSERVDA